MAITLALTLGVLSSVAGSIVWVVTLRRVVKPHIEISPVVAREPGSAGQDPTYRIKLINRSRRAIVEIRVQLDLITRIRQKGGPVLQRTPIEIDPPPPMMIQGLRKSDEDHKNAYRIRFKSAVREKLAESGDAYLRVRIYARDEVSGIGKVFERSYHDPGSEVVEGNFAKGQTFDVVTVMR
jgi:hypothetical protein